MPEAARPDDRLQKLLGMHAADPVDPFCTYGIAQEHARAGRGAEAVAWYDRTIALDASYCYAYFHKARALEELGREDEARQALREGVAAARAANDAHALSELGGYLDQLT